MDLKELLAQKKKALKSKDAANIRAERFKDGQTTLVILPGWREGDAQFWHDYGMHYAKDGAGNWQSHICMDKTFEKECDICAAIGKSINMAGSDTAIEELKKVNASQRYLVNASVIKGGKPSEAVVFELPAGVFTQIIDVMEEWGDLIGEAQARPVIVNREGSGLNTKYTVQPSPKTVALDESILSGRTDLDAVVSQHNPTKYKALIGAVGAIAGIHSALPAGKPTKALGSDSGAFAEVEVDDAEFEEIEPEAASDDLDEFDDIDFLDEIEESA